MVEPVLKYDSNDEIQSCTSVYDDDNGDINPTYEYLFKYRFSPVKSDHDVLLLVLNLP